MAEDEGPVNRLADLNDAEGALSSDDLSWAEDLEHDLAQSAENMAAMAEDILRGAAERVEEEMVTLRLRLIVGSSPPWTSRRLPARRRWRPCSGGRRTRPRQRRMPWTRSGRRCNVTRPGKVRDTPGCDRLHDHRRSHDSHAIPSWFFV
ncbi:hypothetical protein PVAP13_6KG378006 [Panicum virgatum]|uniref:Uncharacterized protein n=1 Tax=Panicum virgatum TaxID=38727 RepID=A0A8T0RKD4_PANVG|nr:hypothetical protein PVAP13_6KG378006 [Panicum virgatum]